MIDETAETNQPIMIIGKRNNAVLISESDWNAINETLYLLSIPGMRDSIQQDDLKADLSDCKKKLVNQETYLPNKHTKTQKSKTDM